MLGGIAIWLAVVQAALVGASLPLFDVALSAPVAAALVTMLAVVVLTAVNQALLAAAGNRVGRLLALGLLALQVAALDGAIPVTAAPDAFRSAADLLPVPLVARGLELTAFGGGTGLGGVVVGLLGWGLLALLVTASAAARRQRWSLAAVRAGVTG